MSAEKIIILGSGYTGIELATLAEDSHFDVIGTTRDAATKEALQKTGATAVEWSVGDDPRPWRAHLGPSSAVVYSIPTLFSTYEAPEEPGKIPRHVAPVAQALEQCIEGGAHRFIYLSSTSVYGDHDGAWIDEETPRRPVSPFGKMRADIEDYLLGKECEFPVTIARLVGIYGPRRALLDSIRSRRFTLVDGGKKITNRIHVHDIARALLAIIERGPSKSGVFNLTDGHPQTLRDLVEFICAETELEFPREETLEEYASRVNNPNALARWKNTARVRNDRLRRELDFDLCFPDVYSGYRAILEESRGGDSSSE